MDSSKKLCKIKPQFVIVRDTGNGYLLDNTVNYNGPFAKHKLSQKSGYNHPSLEIKSNWGDINEYISGVNTGKLTLSAEQFKVLYKAGKVDLRKKGNGYYITSIKQNGAGASINELSQILQQISTKNGNIPYRGSPIEYKRILDYLQFLAVKKIDEDSRLYFSRPNNLTLMRNIRSSNKIQDVFNSIINYENAILYRTAYFVSFDRLAAFASVVRNVPTIYDKAGGKSKKIETTENSIPRTFVKINKKNDDKENIQIIREYILMDLQKDGIKINSRSNSNEIISYRNIPIITQGPLFKWFLNIKTWNKLPNVDLRIKVLFYWIFFYPNANGNNKVPNMKIIEYFLSIADTFHDFGKKSKSFSNIVGTKEEKQNAESKTENGISLSNKPNTSNQLKFIVKLLGADIYRAVDSYNTNVMNTLSTTNKRNVNSSQTKLTSGLKVAHFLYLITNIFGSSASNITKTEEYAGNLMYRLGVRFTKNNTKNLCAQLNDEKACIVVDAISKSLDPCLKNLSIYHNVGILDTAKKGILSLGNLINSKMCIKKKKNNMNNNNNNNNNAQPATKRARL